ncbi:putative phosphatase [Terriglobus roseus DSM 18391]|uniref:phosphoglycolate phosphatase n=1 Tax=Terriglobus roseus (strain DSM 18391 / NRRL B-41598 / KBS 63) TaxID=926566 RepID=I3ZFU4_TERRK|nr:HAD hydrolase-like protein [Terriglobus roseus]AFL88112.1 putative phosphatase [Terriglobus roseus DSM 18391]
MPDSILAGGLNCDLLVFDLDGTLIDSQRDLSNSVNATLAHLQRPELHDTRIAEFIGDGAAMLVRRSLEATGGVSDALMAVALPYFLDYYRAHNLDYTYVYHGVIAELNRLREIAPDLPMAILTNKPFRPSRVICDGLGLSPFFFQNYGSDSFPLKKPDPFGMHALIAEASALLGRQVTAARTVLVGDSHVDVETARNAGALCLGCSYGLAPERLREAKPDHIVDTPTEWISGIRRLLP